MRAIGQSNISLLVLLFPFLWVLKLRSALYWLKRCTCNESILMIIFLFAPFCGLGCYCERKNHTVHLLLPYCFSLCFCSIYLWMSQRQGLLFLQGILAGRYFWIKSIKLFLPILPAFSTFLLLSLTFLHFVLICV